MAALPGIVLPFGDAPAAPQTLDPITCRHAVNSHAAIGLAAHGLRPGRACVLGAGACTDIPLRALAAQFERVALYDLDAESLRAALATLEPDARARVTARVTDITGFAAPLLDRADACLAAATDPDAAIDALTALARDARVGPTEGTLPRSELVVASCVLSQLAISTLRTIERRFVHRFDDPDAARLRGARGWVEATIGLVHALQRAFVRDLARMVAPGGRLYLSATTHVAQVTATADDRWSTPGAYRMTPDARLAASLGPDWSVLFEARWPWVAAPPGIAPGVVYAVDALVLAPR
ncbi:MAG: hypothetical protein R3F65_25700 [bacterium]